MKKRNKFYVDLTPELIQKAQQRVEFILKNGCKVLGVSDKCIGKPDWFDEKYFLECKTIAIDYLSSIGISSLIGLILVLQLPTGLVPLLATGQSKNLSKLFSRYLATLQHVNLWYKFDPFDPNSKAYKSQTQVRIMHKNVAKLMNEKCTVKEYFDKVSNMNLKKNDINDNINNNNINNINLNNTKLNIDPERIWVSQSDMALTQWAFIGICFLEPYKCGIHGANKTKLEKIAYLWRVFGYKIGIEDQYNLFDEIDFDLIYAMCKIVFEKEYLVYLVNVSSPSGLMMGESIILGLKSVMPYMNWKAFINYWYKNLDINSYKINKLNLKDLINVNGFTLINYEYDNKLTENDKEILKKNNYSGKYILPTKNIPFEKLSLETFKEKFYLNLLKVQINYGFKFAFIRNLSRKMSERRLKKSRKNKEKILKKVKKYDEERYFTSCPFAGTINSEYLDFEKYSFKNL